MKKLLLFVAVLCVATNTQAQIKKADYVKNMFETKNKDTVAWTHGGVFNIGANEGFLHNSPSGGEIASLTVNGIFSGFLVRMHHRAIWSNNLDMAYGLYYAYSNSFIPRKTDDRIDFTSKYGYRLDTTRDFYLTGLFNFKSQFTKGYDYTKPNWDSFPNSKFFSPAYLTLAAGFEYRRGTDVSLFFSPAAARLTLVDRYYTTQQAEGAFGVPYGKTSQQAFGAYFSGRYTINISKKMVFGTRLDLYSNYLAKNREVKDSTSTQVIRDNPGNITILWDNLFSYKISKLMALTLGMTITYDNDVPFVKPPVYTTGQELGWVQMKQIFTLAFQYKF